LYLTRRHLAPAHAKLLDLGLAVYFVIAGLHTGSYALFGGCGFVLLVYYMILPRRFEITDTAIVVVIGYEPVLLSCAHT
jgi:hypothetical protein